MRLNFRKWLWRPVEYVLAAALKATATSVVFVVSASALMSWLGYEVPGLSQVFEYFRSVGSLSGILS